MTAGPEPLSRRQFLGLGAAAAGALALSACAGSAAALRPPDLSTGRDSRLKIDNWPGYIDPDAPNAPGSVARFQKQTSMAVTYDEKYADNYSALASGGVIHQLKQSGATGYDIIVPTYWVIQRLKSRGLLEPIPIERIPNHVNIDPLFLEVPWDRGARYQMPWQSGFTGIAWNQALTGGPVHSINQLVTDPKLKGKVGMVTEMREIVGLLMLRRGQDPSRPTTQQANAALDDLEAIVKSGQVKYFTGTEFQQLLPDRTFAACFAWSGGVVQIQAKRPDLLFAIPDEGGVRWFDSMIIPKGAPHVRAAGDWMNFVYDPANAARITAAVNYVSPVVGVQEELRRAGGDGARLADSPVLFPDDATRRRLYFWAGTSAAEEDVLQRRFSEVTGA